MMLLPFIVSKQWLRQNVQGEGHSFNVRGKNNHMFYLIGLELIILRSRVKGQYDLTKKMSKVTVIV